MSVRGWMRFAMHHDRARAGGQIKRRIVTGGVTGGRASCAAAAIIEFMKSLIPRVLAVGALVTAITAGTSAQQRERSAVPDKYKWNLAEIYPSDQAWRAAKDKLVAEIPAVRAFKGTLGSSPQKLADALELTNRLAKDFSRL